MYRQEANINIVSNQKLQSVQINIPEWILCLQRLDFHVLANIEKLIITDRPSFVFGFVWYVFTLKFCLVQSWSVRSWECLTDEKKKTLGI